MMGKIARETEYQGLRIAVCEDGTLWGKRVSEDWREIMAMHGTTPIYFVQPRWLGPISPRTEAEALAGRYPDRGGE